MNAKAKQRHCSQRGNPRLFDSELAWAGTGLTGRGRAGRDRLDLTKQAHPNANDDRQHHDFDARRDDIAKNALGQKRCLTE
jgi:hypothetical protein